MPHSFRDHVLCLLQSRLAGFPTNVVEPQNPSGFHRVINLRTNTVSWLINLSQSFQKLDVPRLLRRVSGGLPRADVPPDGAAQPDRKPVPAVDGDDGKRQGSNLLIGEHRGNFFIDIIGRPGLWKKGQ